MVARIVLALAFALPVSVWAQSFNGTFESLQPNGVPAGWSLADPGGSAVSTEAHLGKRAAKAWIHDAYRPGTWISKSSGAEGNASEVTGYYKYLGDKKQCDKAKVSYLLGAKAMDGGIDTMAYGLTELKLEKDYTKFSLSVSAVNAGTPEFMSIMLTPVGHCNIHGQENCCFLYVDDIILAGSTSLEAPAPEENLEETPAEEVSDSVSKSEPVMEETPQPAEEEAVEPVKEEVTPPAEEKKAEEQTTPAEEEAAPAEEEGTSEPVEEGWDKGEESSSDGGR